MTSRHHPDKELLAAWVDKRKKAALIATAEALGLATAEALERAIAEWVERSGVNT